MPFIIFVLFMFVVIGLLASIYIQKHPKEEPKIIGTYFSHYKIIEKTQKTEKVFLGKHCTFNNLFYHYYNSGKFFTVTYNRYIIETYHKEVSVISFEPPKHVYISFKFEDGKIKQYYISKYCSVNKIKKAIQEKTQYTLHFDVYEEVEYDGKIDRTTRMKESLYALFCQ